MVNIKKKIIKNILLLSGVIFILLSLIILVNYFSDKYIKSQLNKDSIISNINKNYKQSLDEFDKLSNLINSSTNIHKIEIKNLQNKYKFYLKQLNDISEENLINLLFVNNSVFYNIKSKMLTQFYYQNKFGYDIENNQIREYYQPNRFISIKRHIRFKTDLTKNEINKIQKELVYIRHLIIKDLNIIIKKIDNDIKTNKYFNPNILTTNYKNSLQQLKINDIEIIKKYTPNMIINMMLLSKIAFIAIITTFIIVLFIILKNLINSYNKFDIMETLQNSNINLDKFNVNKNWEIILMANEIYQNKKEKIKDTLEEK